MFSTFPEDTAYQSDKEWPSERVSLLTNQSPDFGTINKL